MSIATLLPPFILLKPGINISYSHTTSAWKYRITPDIPNNTEVHFIRVLPKIQIHWDKWPTGFEKGGPFQKEWGPGELSIYDANGLSTFI